MAQDFSTRYQTIDGHGNFGSVDGDSAAAMRYTEARMHKITQSMLADIDCETVDFTPNFDGSLQEPSVLPVRLPMLFIKRGIRYCRRYGNKHPSSQPWRNCGRNYCID